MIYIHHTILLKYCEVSVQDFMDTYVTVYRLGIDISESNGDKSTTTETEDMETNTTNIQENASAFSKLSFTQESTQPSQLPHIPVLSTPLTSSKSRAIQDTNASRRSTSQQVSSSQDEPPYPFMTLISTILGHMKSMRHRNV